MFTSSVAFHVLSSWVFYCHGLTYSGIQNFFWIQRKLEDIGSGPGLLLCLVEGTELTSISGEVRSSCISTPRRTLVWEEERVWVVWRPLCLSRERKKLKNHESLVVEHLLSRILPREKPPCFQKLWVQKKKRNVHKPTAWKKVPSMFCLRLGERIVRDEWCETYLTG